MNYQNTSIISCDLNIQLLEDVKQLRSANVEEIDQALHDARKSFELVMVYDLFFNLPLT